MRGGRHFALKGAFLPRSRGRAVRFVPKNLPFVAQKTV